MMEIAFLEAIYSRLSGDAELASMGVEISDVSPQVSDADPAISFPRVTIGHLDAREWDTKDADGLDALLRIHTYSSTGETMETRRIQSRIYELLHRRQVELTVDPAFGLTVLRRDNSDLIEETNRIMHGVCEYRALMHVA